MLKTNLESLIEVVVSGSIAHPAPLGHSPSASGYSSTFEGKGFIPMVSASIALNVKVGDRAFGWAWGDHVIPGVALRNSDRASNTALQTLACIGNEATVVNTLFDGKVKGATGVVAGKTGCSEALSVWFPRRVLDRLAIGDLIQIKASGQGLSLPEHPNVAIMNCGPSLFKAINPTEKGGRIRLAVTCIIPGKLMGSGIGAANSYYEGCDIQSTSLKAIKEYKLIENIRLGDIIAIADFDATTGARWHNGAMTIGVIVHGASMVAGHGPGVSFLFSSSEGQIEPIITRKANIADLLNLA